MKLTNLDGSTLMQVDSLATEGSNLVIKGTILGSMPITSVLTPGEARSVFRLLSLKQIWFLVTFLFRK